MLVAKSYAELERVKEPYQQNGKYYVDVKLKSGKIKQVRAYTETEYNKMYKSAAPASFVSDLGYEYNGDIYSPDYDPSCETDPVNRINQKEALGFQKGFITIFKGYDEATHAEYFRANPTACYSRIWGWYIRSNDCVPADLPYGVQPVKLQWSDIGANPYHVKRDREVTKAVEAILYDTTPSEFQGTIGSRIDREIKVIKAVPIESQYANTQIYILEDPAQNQYVWKTASRTWDVGYCTYIRGTVKEHNLFHGTKQTVLTRCLEISKGAVK